MNIRYANKVEVKCHYNSLLPIYDELYSHLVQDCSDTIHSILIEDIDVDRVLFELNNFKCIVNLNDNSVSHSNNYPYSSKEYTIPKRIRDSLVCIQKLSDKPIHKILFIKPNCIESIVPYWYEVISPRCPSEIDTYFYFVQFRSV